MGIRIKLKSNKDHDALLAATHAVAQFASQWRDRKNDKACEVELGDAFLQRLHRGERADVYLYEAKDFRCCLKWFHDTRWFSRLKNQLGVGRAHAAYRKGLKLSQLEISAPELLGLVRYGFFGPVAMAMEMVDGFRQMNLVLREWAEETDDLSLDPRCIQLAEQFAIFTADMHSKSVLHQDFSPRNVLMKTSATGFEFCLVDFEDVCFSGQAVTNIHHFEKRLARYVSGDALEIFVKRFNAVYCTAQPFSIVVTRLQNIGDMLVFLPAVRALRKSLPHAKITLLAKHAPGVEIAKGCPYIDDMIIVRGRSLLEKARLIFEFRRRRLDYFIISPQDLGRVPWALMGGAKRIVGYPRVFNYSKWKKEKLVSCMHLPVEYDRGRTEVENCLELMATVVRDAGADWEKPDLALEYSWVSEEERSSANHVLQNLGLISGKYVVSAPYSKREAKNWPEDRFVELFKRIHAKWGYSVVLIGGPAEYLMAESLKKNLGEWVHVLAGKTSLGESSEIIRQAVFMVGPDSGPTFIGSAVGLPVVAFYGPADFARWIPPVSSAPRINIFHDRECNPCKHQQCPLPSSCMDEILLEEVWGAVEEVNKI